MKKLLLLLSVAVCGVVLYVITPAHAQTAVTGRKDGFNCVVAVSTSTSLTAACSAISSNRPLFITDIEFGSSAASGTAADSFPTLKYGTGTTCGTGTTIFWQALTAANTTQTSDLITPIKIPQGNDVCWIMTTAGSKTIQIHGFYGDINQ
jgi:hypothetical protein